MRTSLIVSLSLCWIAGAAFAQVGPSQSPIPKQSDGSAPPAGGLAPGNKKGKARPGDGAEKQVENPYGTDALKSCLAMWEPATHMTRREWARACRRVAERLKSTTVK
jgi:hypothetical protein